jgi:hypothetical protein
VELLLLLALKLAIIGFILWLIITYVFKNVIVGVAVIVLLYWLITTYGNKL